MTDRKLPRPAHPARAYPPARWAVGLATLLALGLPPQVRAQAASSKATPPAQPTPAQLVAKLNQLMDGLQTVGSQITQLDTGIGCGCVGPHIGPNFQVKARHYAQADVERALQAMALILRNGNAGKATEVAKAGP